MNIKQKLLIGLIFSIFISCEKNNISQNPSIDSINFTHTVDRISLILGADTCCNEGSLLPYTNENGQEYNIQVLKYLISNITLHTIDTSYKIKDVHYINVEDESTLTIDVTGLDNLNYTGISFTMGLDNTMNVNDTYINNSWHSTMFWPVTMGGGYHYMKLEGDFDTITKGYTTHTGPTMGMDHSFSKYFPVDLNNIRSTTNISININMNINNWYTNPNNFTLTNEGIMMNMSKQMMLLANGEEDVFSILLE